MRFDLTDLRLFLHVVESGSITHGADRANMALPSASARLRGMEDLIGLPLLDRGRRGVEPTSAGVTLVHHARLVLRQIEAMHGELGEYASGQRGQIRLLSNTAAMTEFLPARLADFLAGHPGIDIDLKERQSGEIVKAVTGGFADIGIALESVIMDTLETRPFATEQLVLVTPRDHPLAAHRKIAFAEAAAADFVGLSLPSPLQDYIEAWALRDGKAVSLRVRLRTFDGLCQLVEAGVGLAIMPETAARARRKSTRIAMIRLSDSWATRSLSLCFREFGTLSIHARGLVEELAERAP